MCQGTGVKHSFLCPNNTIFNQHLLVCDWYNRVHCDDSMLRNSMSAYSRNSNLNIHPHHRNNKAGNNPQWRSTEPQARSNNYDSFKKKKGKHRKWQEQQTIFDSTQRGLNSNMANNNYAQRNVDARKTMSLTQV
ncbi:chitin-binding type-2 domain-containing protein [Caerostris extrusa]|uniref:Chitin-binding type-2 domain-containing protein n=1 Tax=Caerostris extrusa TaxID=172846 RepID=A0AAV4UZ58_CAEEX|nr:chitin-binding type-2 domain-containing protein [Caerostris extrusa]